MFEEVRPGPLLFGGPGLFKTFGISVTVGDFVIFGYLSSPTEKPDRHTFPKIPKSPNPKDFRRGGGADLFNKSLEFLESLEFLVFQGG